MWSPRPASVQTRRHYARVERRKQGQPGNTSFLGVKRDTGDTEAKNMHKLWEGRIIQTKPGACQRTNAIWAKARERPSARFGDMGPIQSSAEESLGYPTQKPLALWRHPEFDNNPNDGAGASAGRGTALVAYKVSVASDWYRHFAHCVCRVARALRDVGCRRMKNSVCRGGLCRPRPAGEYH